MKKILVAVMAATTVMAVPVISAEAKSSNHGRHGGHGHASSPHADRGHGARSDHSSRRCERSQRVGFTVEGALADFSDSSITLTVAHANHHARTWLASHDPVFSTVGARLSFDGVTDADGNGVDLGDVQPTDTVKVIGKLVRPKHGCSGDSSVVVRRIQVTREDDDEGTPPSDYNPPPSDYNPPPSDYAPPTGYAPPAG